MEVELSVLHATNLAKRYECYAKVYVQMDESEPEVKLGNTAMSKEEHILGVGRKPDVYTTANPMWDSTTKNKFVVAIPFPSNWMEAKPKTKVWVSLWDKNSMARNKCLGEVVLRWDDLVHPSMRDYALEAPPDKSGNGGAGSDNEGDASSVRKAKSVEKRIQGTLTLRVRQLQAVEIYLLGAYGLCPRDTNGKSDPFVEITCHSGGVAGGVAGEGESDAQLEAEEAAAAMAAGDPEIVTETQRGKKARTPYIKKTLSPHWFHKILLTRALNPSTKDIKANEDEKKRRIKCLEQKFGITSYKDANGKSRGWKDHVMDAAMSFDREDNLSVRLTLFDHDELGGPEFLGMVDLTPSMILDRTNQGGVLRLPLKDDMRRKKRVDVSGYIELEIMVGAYHDDRAGVKPELQALGALDLALTVQKADKIATADANGFSDAFVEVHGKNVLNPKNAMLAGELLVGKTKAHKKTLNPVWNESFLLTLQSNPDAIAAAADGGFEESKGGGGSSQSGVVLQLYDHDNMGANDFLGECRLQYSELIDNDPSTKKLKLRGSDGTTGKIKPSKKQFDWMACKSIDAIDFENGDLGEMFVNMSLMSRVEVNVLEAFGLKAVNSGGKDSDPQLSLSLVGLKEEPLATNGKKKSKKGGPEVKKSRILYKTLEPEFYESFTFSVPTANNDEVALVIDVKDSGAFGKRTFMGQIRIPAATLLDPPPNPQAYALYDDATPGAPVTSGITGFIELHLRSSYLPDWVKDNLPKPQAILPPPPRTAGDDGMGMDQTYIEGNSSMHDAHGMTGRWGEESMADMGEGSTETDANQSNLGIDYGDMEYDDQGEAVERDVAAARNQSLDEGGGPSYGEVDLTPRGDRHPGDRHPRSAGASRGEASGTASSPGVRRHIKGLNHGLGYLGVDSPPLPPRTRASPRASRTAAATAAPTVSTALANAEAARAAALAMKRGAVAKGVEGATATPTAPRRRASPALPKRQSPPLPRR